MNTKTTTRHLQTTPSPTVPEGHPATENSNQLVLEGHHPDFVGESAGSDASDRSAIEAVPGTDIVVMPFTITVLKPLVPGQPRGNSREQVEHRTIVEIAEQDIPKGSNAYIEALRVAQAITPKGFTSSVRPGQRQLRRVYDTQARVV